MATPFQESELLTGGQKFPMNLLINNQFLVSVCCVYRGKKKACTWDV